jgi:hypothetical protein
MASQTREEGKSWSGWSDLEDSSILITLDVDLQRITVYTRDKQVFDIAEYEGLTEDEDGDEIFSFYCVDN